MNVVERIAKQKLVEEIVGNITNNSNDEDLKDLVNDIYLDLLEKPKEMLSGIYERNQMNYFITRMVMNNINSIHSRFYYVYGRYKNNKTSMDETSEKGERERYDSD